jgi:hypothetical protein
MARRIIYLYIITGFCVLHANAQVAPAPYAPGTALNSITIYEATTPETDWYSFIGKAPVKVKQTTQYLDGLGRPIQKVTKQGSPQGKDVVNATYYDELGRQPHEFMPFVSVQTPGGSEVTDNGGLKLNPFQQQQTFYQNLLTGQNETHFYSQTDFEASPMNRPVKNLKPGNSWV